MEILSNLFGSEARVKMMRLFLFNPGLILDAKSISRRTGLRTSAVKKEIKLLSKAKLIKRKRSGYILSAGFPYLLILRDLLLQNVSLHEENILKKLQRVGRLKEVAFSGVFLQDWDARADILVVADRINRRVLENIMKRLEEEIGREIKYIALESTEFQYRLEMGDRLIRDILDYPHRVALDRLGVLA